jgi:hypothetical protein
LRSHFLFDYRSFPLAGRYQRGRYGRFVFVVSYDGFHYGYCGYGEVYGNDGWIANNSTGTNGSIGTWTFFVFRQTFDLTGYDPNTADLKFQWAADDSGQGGDRGSWTPKYSLNGGSLVAGTWPGGSSYSFGPTVDLSSGFVPGQNVIDFYVEGNGVTDGFALNPISFQASVPEPASLTLFGIAAASGLGYFGLRRKLAKAEVEVLSVSDRLFLLLGAVGVRVLSVRCCRCQIVFFSYWDNSEPPQ